MTREEKTKSIIRKLESLGIIPADTPERAAQIKAENEDPEIAAYKVNLIEGLIADSEFSKLFKVFC